MLTEQDLETIAESLALNIAQTNIGMMIVLRALQKQPNFDKSSFTTEISAAINSCSSDQESIKVFLQGLL